ncbi:MAG TPA: plastocyanin/azurin family copper-binding protein [Solirubrobacteraceae bacterium]|nr:plastocyanin/azurin family copper-binding protein [Solirubrobacteraceae bacterium]
MKRTGAWVVGSTCGVALLFSATATAATRTVYAGTPSKLTQKIASKLIPNLKSFGGKYNPDINSFFNQRLTIHTGDTVSFRIQGFHTVDLPGSARSALPLILPNGTTTGINDAAGSPFWFNGLPSLGVNPALLARQGPATYDGTTRIDTGVPVGPAKPLNVKFNKPGAYRYFCDVHPGMVGTVIVKPKGKKIPSAKQSQKALVRQITGDVKVVKKLAKSRPASNTVSLGESADDGVELFTMFPQTLKVKPNTTVTFTMSKDTREVHTATFGPTSVLKTLSDGFAGANFPSQGLYPSDPASIVVSPTSHGDGFGNTGALDEDPATPQIPTSNKIDFTTAGTYHFQCLIHPFMQGTIVVQ